MKGDWLWPKCSNYPVKLKKKVRDINKVTKTHITTRILIQSRLNFIYKPAEQFLLRNEKWLTLTKVLKIHYEISVLMFIKKDIKYI